MQVVNKLINCKVNVIKMQVSFNNRRSGTSFINSNSEIKRFKILKI